MSTTTIPSPSRFFIWRVTPTSLLYTLSLHDALPISMPSSASMVAACIDLWTIRRLATMVTSLPGRSTLRSEEHTSELQSLRHLVCRLLLEKKTTQDYSNKKKRTRAGAPAILTRQKNQ